MHKFFWVSHRIGDADFRHCKSQLKQTLFHFISLYISSAITFCQQKPQTWSYSFKYLIALVVVPWNYNTNRNNISENFLLQMQLSLQMSYCWKYKSWYTFFKSPASKKHRILIGLWKKVFVNLPIVFIDWNNKTKLEPAFCRTFKRKAYIT